MYTCGVLNVTSVGEEMWKLRVEIVLDAEEVWSVAITARA